MVRVIRGAGDARVPAARFDAAAEAGELLAEARGEAERIRAEARKAMDAEREAMREEARARARAKVAAALVAVEDARAEAVRDVADALPKLAVAVAEKLVGAALTADPALLRHAASDALARVPRAETVVLRVHPDAVAELPALEAEVVADPSLGPGDVVVESSVGSVDGRLAVRLDALRRALEAAKR